MHRALSFQEKASANLSPEALGLRFLWLELTHKCNLACRHCYVSANSEQPLHDHMTMRHWRSVLAEAGFLGCKRVQFIGGEPRLITDGGKVNNWLAGWSRDGRLLAFSSNRRKQYRGHEYFDLTAEFCERSTGRSCR